MPIANVSGSNFTTLYSSQGNAAPLIPIPPANANVSGQNFTTLYSLGSGVAPVPIEPYGNANVESFLAVGSDSGGNTVGNITSSGQISATGNITTDQYFIGTFLGNIAGNLVVPGFNTQVLYNNNGNAGANSGLTFVASSNTLTSGNVVSAVGNIQGGNIRTAGQVSATGNVTGNYFLGNGSQLTGLPATYGNANVSNFLASGNNTSNITTTANVAGTYFLGNGSQLTGLPVQYSNANVTTLLANFGSNVISTTGNVTAGYFIGNGSTLTNITAGNITGQVANALVAGTVYTNAQPNITSVGILTVINTSGAISATGNITGNVFSGNGAGLTNINAANIIGAYGNANVAANLAAFATNPISTSGNITAGYFTGNGSLLTSITGANVTGVVANATYALNANAATYATDAVQANYANIANSVAGANVTGTVANATYALNSNAATFAGTVTTAAQPNITSVGILTAINTSGAISATGNITGNVFIGNGSGLTNINAANIIGAYGNANVAANLAAFANNPISTSGNITAGYFTGNGSALTSLTGANVTGVVANATYALNANAATYSTYAVDAVQANYANIANSVAGANVSGTVANATYALNANAATYATDAVQANYANIANSVAGANVTGTVGLAQYVTQAAQGNITSVGTLTALSVSGNITTGNLTTPGNVTADYFIGNIAGNVSGNSISVSGNITGGNLLTGGLISAAGNITGNYIIGNGSELSNITGANVTGTVPLAQYVTQNAQANITSVGTLTSLSVSGNVDAGNLRTAGLVTATGNVSGGNVFVPVNGRYYGDFTTGTASGRTAFQTTATGNSAATTLTAIPGPNHTVSNTAFSSQLNLFANGADVGNSAFGRMQMFGNRVEFAATASGNATAGNMRFAAGPAQIVLLNTGNVGISNADPQHTLSVQATLFVGTDLSVQGNITNVQTISASGNITGGNLITPGLITAVGNVDGGNLRTAGQVTATGNITAGNITNNGTITSVGNITAPNFIGNVIGNIDAGGSNTQVQFNDSDILNGTAGFVFDKTSNAVVITGNITSANVNTAGLIAATGNITGGNLITGGLITAVGNVTGGNIASLGTVTAAGNIGSTQQTIIGTANATASSTGNIVVSGRNIATDVVFAPDASTTTTPTGGRVLIGSGVAGNTLLTAWDNNNQLRGTRVAIMDAYTKNNSSVQGGALKSWSAVTLDGNITATAVRIQGIGAALNVGGGSAGNTYLPTQQGGVAAFGIAPVVSILNLGGANPNLVTQIGANVGTAYSTAYGAITQTYGSGTYVGNMQGFHAGFFTNNTVSNIRTVIGYSINAGDNAGNTTAVGNTIGFLFPGQAAGGTEGQYGAAVSGSFIKGNVYAFMNAGNLAQVRLGSTREQHYYAYPHTTTTGNVIVDATNGKVQTLTPTGNVTITDFTNFVNYATNNALGTNIPQQDDVTLIITQPEFAPFYTVTLPTTVVTGGYPVQYQNGLQTVASTSLARTFVTIRPSPAGTNGFPWYVSVAASSGALAAAGSNTQIQFNDAGVMGANSRFNYNVANSLMTAGNINVYDGTSAWGDINAGNIFTIGAGSLVSVAGRVEAAGNVTGGNVNTAGLVSATGNITSAQNIITQNLLANAIYDNGAGNIGMITGNVQVTGNLNISSDFTANTMSAFAFISAPSLYTSQVTPPGGGPLNTSTTLSTISGNLSVTGTITGAGNVTGGNLLTAGSVSATGNVTSGNVLTGGLISSTGNITGGNLTTTGQSTLGALNTFSQNQYSLGASGNINIDKNNGQVQYIAASGNVTIGSFTNFLTTAGSGNQTDTVTVIVRQGSPSSYTITMPTGNASIKYAANLTTVGTTANSVTMFNITAANVASVPLYMITISPEFI